MDVRRLIEQLEHLDAADAPTAELIAGSAAIHRVRAFLHSKEAEISVRAAALHAEGACVPPEDLHARHGRMSRRDAAKTARRATLVTEMPALAARLSEGRIGPEHLDTVAAAAAPLDDDTRARFAAAQSELAEAAASMTPERFRRFVRRTVDALTGDDGLDRSDRQRRAARVSLGIDHQTGMGFIRGDLHPEQYQRIRRVLDTEVAALKKRSEFAELGRDQLRAEALCRLVTGARSSGPRNRAEMSVLIDLDSLMGGLDEHGVCEYSDGASLPVATARRLACDAGIIPVVLGGEGVPLDIGRASRLATPDQRRALRSMYRGCAIDGCDRHFDDCEIHHLLEWIEQRGPTDLVNLLPLCSHHHHRVHEGRWRLELDPIDRTLTVWLPDGSLHSRSRPHLVADRTAGQAA